MPAVNITKKLRLYETSVLLRKDAVAGSLKDSFQITNGSRMVVTLQVLQISVGASVQLVVRNAFAVDLPLIDLITMNQNAVGQATRIITDFHNIFEVEVVVSGGTADIAVGVSLADNANSTRIENAVIETDVSAYPGVDGKYDSVRVSDGVDEMKINPNGSINVNIVDGDGSLEETKEAFDSALSVAAGVEVLVAQHTVPVGKKVLLQRIDFGGGNIAEYRYYKNGVLTGKKRTYWSGPFHGSFEFFTGSEEGMPLAENDQVQLKVIHQRPSAADFEARIQFREITV